MSTEKIILTEKKNLSNLITPTPNKTISSGRVDINNLLARARKEKDKENRVNLVFFGLFTILILVVGILLSL
tara:strand:+ start:320 stop:535 length:216 start_codon:yes stop_codon:yes gene_type:complete